MDVLLLSQHLLNGLLYGFLYALAASGLALLYGVVDVINFSHGELLMLGAYFLFVFSIFQDNIFFAFALALISMIILGFILNRVVFTPSLKISWSAPLLVTLGLSIFLKNTVLLVFGARPKWIQTPLSEVPLNIAGIRISALYIVIFVVTLGAFMSLQFFITRTKTGKCMRALSQNRELCDVLGMNVVRIFDITVIISMIMASLGGGLYGIMFSITPNMGALLGLKVFMIVVISGFKNVKGSIIVALMAGIIESMVAAFFMMEIKDLVLFIAAAVIAAVKPEGLFGKKAGVW